MTTQSFQAGAVSDSLLNAIHKDIWVSDWSGRELRREKEREKARQMRAATKPARSDSKGFK